ncbi:MAG: eukaryotic-like serine/threonine-protein kinase, partial [Candidatus Hydrogenedentes bacterium]|nr:eukaryotic-like serine/threonine-protein kinase [Candidatus Hydrogenedentota bacterium]
VVSPDDFWFKAPDESKPPQEPEKPVKKVDDKARIEAEKKAQEKAEAEKKAQQEAEAEKARVEADKKAQEEAEAEKARIEADKKAQEEAEAEKARIDADKKAQEEAEAEKARIEADTKAQEEAEAEKARIEAEKKAQEEAEAEKARIEAEKKAQEEAETARIEAEMKAQEEAEAEKARLETEKKAQEEAQRAEKARIEAEKAEAQRAAETPLQPGLTRKIANIEFVYIPDGKFEMGSKLDTEDIALIFGGDARHYVDELPRHDVNISKGFWMGKYEVTNAQFAEFVEATEYKTDAEREGWGRVWNGTDWENREGACWRNPGWTPDPDQPVVLVSWNDARAHIDWLNLRGEGRFHLPSEAQWEYACHANGIGIYSYGDDSSILGDYARFRANSMALGEFYPSPVGTKRPNDWGLYDMHGNVGEWCQDWYDEKYYSYSPKTDPKGPEDGTYRALRGGSWYSFARFCRTTSRTRGVPNYRYYVLGYRLCCAE